jgi:hypothetical protein
MRKYSRCLFCLFLALAGSLALAPGGAGPVETLTATGALPAHITGRFRDPVGFVAASDGRTIVLDRRDHTVYVIDRARDTVTQVLKVGLEQGRLFYPGALALADDQFVVADAPNGFERLQTFTLEGRQVGAFYLDQQTRLAPRLTIGPRVINGVGSVDFTGTTFLVGRPESGGLFVEYDYVGRPVRTMGELRATGQEGDRHLHLALNTGVPLADPTGGFYFVFSTGRPMFRKYDANGTLLFERHIEGVELDGQILTLPTTWPTRDTDAGRLPIVNALVRTAAVDREGRLWISLMTPFTYVYDRGGDKIRTVRFQSASGTLSPASLFFANDGRLLVTPGCYEFRPDRGLED